MNPDDPLDPERSRLSPTLSGIAGEYFVAGELSRRGYIASITLRNTRGIDMLVSNAEATKSVAIQVKTTQGNIPVWILNFGKSMSENGAANSFFVFVRLNHLDGPRYHVVPRAEVLKSASEEHTAWLQTPGRKGQPRKDSTVRNFRDPEGKYLNRWDLLGL